jgi:hypothetical protein
VRVGRSFILPTQNAVLESVAFGRAPARQGMRYLITAPFTANQNQIVVVAAAMTGFAGGAPMLMVKINVDENKGTHIDSFPSNALPPLAARLGNPQWLNPSA